MTRVYRALPVLRALMLEHGLALLRDNGLAAGAPTFADVFDHIEAAGLPRATKGSLLGPGRLWASQRHYQTDLEIHALRTWAATTFEVPEVEQQVRRTLAEADVSSVASRRLAFAEYVRAVGRSSFEASNADPLWRVFVAIWARVMSSQGEVHSELVAALREARQSAAVSIRDGLIRPAVEGLGLRAANPDWTLEQASTWCADAAVAIGQGVSLDVQLFGAPTLLDRPTGPGGGLREWTLHAVALDGLAAQFLEVDPDWTPPSR